MKPDIQKILVIKTSSLGDIIHTLPAVSLLKSNLPQAEIDWLVEEPFLDFFETQKLDYHLIPLNRKDKRFASLLKSKTFQEIRKKSYDLLIDFQGNSKSALFTLLAKAKIKLGFSFSSVSEWPNILATNCRFQVDQSKNIREQYIELVSKFFLKMGMSFKRIEPILENLSFTHSSLRIMVCPFSNWKNKMVPWDLLKRLLFVLKEELNPEFVFLSGTDKEKSLAKSYASFFYPHAHLLEKPKSSDLFLEMQKVDLIIAVDSFPMHLAGLTETPLFGFFGPSLASIYAPMKENIITFQGSCPLEEVFTKRCSNIRSCSHNLCMNEELIDRAITALKKWPLYMQLKQNLSHK